MFKSLDQVSSGKWSSLGQVTKKKFKIFFKVKKKFKLIKKSYNFRNTSKVYPWNKFYCHRIFKKDVMVTFYVLNNIFSYNHGDFDSIYLIFFITVFFIRIFFLRIFFDLNFLQQSFFIRSISTWTVIYL